MARIGIFSGGHGRTPTRVGSNLKIVVVLSINIRVSTVFKRKIRGSVLFQTTRYHESSVTSHFRIQLILFCFVVGMVFVVLLAPVVEEL